MVIIFVHETPKNKNKNKSQKIQTQQPLFSPVKLCPTNISFVYLNLLLPVMRGIILLSFVLTSCLAADAVPAAADAAAAC